jgi:hypothetical protein
MSSDGPGQGGAVFVCSRQETGAWVLAVLVAGSFCWLGVKFCLGEFFLSFMGIGMENLPEVETMCCCFSFGPACRVSLMVVVMICVFF